MIFLTSINPKSHQKETIESWLTYGKIISFNRKDEIDQLVAKHPYVSFQESDSRSIQTILNSTQKDRLYCLINDDILISNNQFERAIDHAISGKLVAGKKWNYESSPTNATMDNWGIDAFIFQGDIVKNISLPDCFIFGKPWWDYALPYATLKDGKDVVRFESKCLLHKKHPVRWNNQDWIGLCLEFLKWNGTAIPNRDPQNIAEAVNEIIYREIYVKRDRI